MRRTLLWVVWSTLGQGTHPHVAAAARGLDLPHFRKLTLSQLSLHDIAPVFAPNYFTPVQQAHASVRAALRCLAAAAARARNTRRAVQPLQSVFNTTLQNEVSQLLLPYKNCRCCGTALDNTTPVNPSNCLKLGVLPPMTFS